MNSNVYVVRWYLDPQDEEADSSVCGSHENISGERSPELTPLSPREEARFLFILVSPGCCLFQGHSTNIQQKFDKA